MKNLLFKFYCLALLASIGIVCRLLPHPANFAPIGAIAIFGGIYLPKKWALTIPLLTMFVGDIFIGFYNFPIIITVYTCFIISVVIGMTVKKNKKFPAIAGKILLGSIIFFFATNWAVWMFGSFYPHTFIGLWQCYIAALPFFRNSLLGDIFYTVILIGGMEIILNRKVILQAREAQV